MINYATCPDCEVRMQVSRTHNGIAFVWHGICPKCKWAHQFAELENVSPKNQKSNTTNFVK